MKRYSEYIVRYWNDDSIDFQEGIVRCKDCVAYMPFRTYSDVELDYGECMRHRRQADEDRFCAWGERKERIES